MQNAVLWIHITLMRILMRIRIRIFLGADADPQPDPQHWQNVPTVVTYLSFKIIPFPLTPAQ